MAKHYKIHPAIGIARVGTSSEFYLAPEAPGTFARPEDGRYRDGAQKLRRQATRFRVFEYDDANPAAVPREVVANADGIARIEWTVHLANKKAFWFEFAGLKGEGPAGYPPGHLLRNKGIMDPVERRRRLIIDPGPRRLTDRNQHIEIAQGNSGGYPETWPGPQTDGKAITALGTLVTDAQGRLIAAGGFGTSVAPGTTPSGSLNFDNNDGWFDDVSDGPVRARIIFADGATQDATPAWLIVGPPDFAPPIENIVTLYDVLYDLAVRQFNSAPALFDAAAGQFQSTYEPSFTAELYPILRRAAGYAWVNGGANNHHRWNFTALSHRPFVPAPGVLSPVAIFQRLRQPENWRVPFEDDHLMPLLHGDEGELTALTLTPTQYHIMRQWRLGIFKADWPGTPPPPDLAITAAGLDRAALESCSGGAFFPGMEAGWIMRDPRIYQEPFRFKPALAFDAEQNLNGLTPGSVTMRMALPWQADFLKCGNNWWPAQRPNQVRLGPAAPAGVADWARGINDHVDLVNRWALLGVVVPAANPNNSVQFHEAERVLP
jgi:hypothetical protein